MFYRASELLPPCGPLSSQVHRLQLSARDRPASMLGNRRASPQRAAQCNRLSDSCPSFSSKWPHLPFASKVHSACRSRNWCRQSLASCQSANHPPTCSASTDPTFSFAVRKDKKLNISFPVGEDETRNRTPPFSQTLFLRVIRGCHSRASLLTHEH